MCKLYFIRLLLFNYVLFQAHYKALSQVTSSTDYFRSTGTGNWNSASSWESSADGSTNWIPSTLVPTEVANIITIRNGHTITINTNTTLDQVVIASGGILDLATGSSTVLTVNDGAGNDIIVQSGGVFKHNITGSASSLPLFTGSATIEIQSDGILEAATNNGTPSDYAVTTSGTSSHVIWDDNSIFNWNNASNPVDGITYFPSGNAIPIFRVSQPISIGNTNATVLNGLLETNANVSLSSAGSKTFRNGIVGSGTVAATAVNGGPFIVNGITAKLGGGTITLNNAGLSIGPATVITLISNKTINAFAGGTGGITLSGTLVCDDYVIGGNSKIQIDGTLKTTNANGLTGSSTTTFAAGFTVNSFGSASSIEYNRVGVQTVTPLTYNNLNISGSGTKNASAAADVFVSGVLDISANNTFALNGTNHLKLNGSGTLNINANAFFDNGGESQVSGGGSPTINIYGTFITRDAQGFTGTNTSIPGATSTPTIALNIYPGSTIEYGRAGDQQVSSRSDYKNMTFSGSGTKTLATFTPIGTITIKDNAIVDASNKTFGDTTATNLTMTGGRFIVAGNSTKPDIAGTYTLTGGVIEFAGGTASSRQNIRSTPTYLNIEVTGPNVGNSSSTTKLADGGSFTVKTGASYENSNNKIDGAAGIQTFTMEAGATFKTGVASGFSGSGSQAVSNIETITVDPKSTIIYSRLADQAITPLAGGYPTLLLKGSGIKTVASGTLDVAATADSIVIDPSVIFKVGSGAKANFNNRRVIVHSNAGGTGIIGEITDGASGLLNATNVTIERYIPARRAFRLLCSPVTTSTSIKANWMEGQSNPPPAYSINNNNYPGYGTHITGSSGPNDGFDATSTNNPSLFTFNNSTQVWDAVANTGGTLRGGVGYRLFVRGSRSVNLSNNAPTASNTILRVTGSLQAGSAVYNESSTPAISGGINNYSLLGNPYASPVDWDALGKSGLSSYYYVWDPNLNTRGAYATYGNNITSPAASQADQNIQGGQAFFVRTTSANPSLTFNETNKTIINKSVFRTSSSITSLGIQLLLNSTAGSEHVADGVTVCFDDLFSASIAAEDATKITNIDENMSIASNGSALSIEGRPNVISHDTIQLQMVQFRQENYYLKFEPHNFSSSMAAVIKDNFLKQETIINLSSTGLLPFSITSDPASFAPNRFVVIFKSSKVLPITIIDTKAFKKQLGIEVEWLAETETGIESYEVEKSTDGRQFQKAGAVAARGNRNLKERYNWYDADVYGSTSCYRIKCIEKTGTITYSNQVCINTERADKSITVFPNPAKGNVINLMMNNMQRGNYTLTLYNNTGQKIYTAVVHCNSTIETIKISAGRVITKGNYKLKITSKDTAFFENVLFE